MFNTLVVSGIATGLVYAVIALGIVVLVKTTDGVNFAHGEVVAIGGFVTYSIVTQTGGGFLGATLIAIGVALALGFAFFSICSSLFDPKRAASLLVATIGLSFVLKGLCRRIWGGQGDFLSVPPIVDGSPIMLSDSLVIPLQSLAIGIGATVTVVSFVAIFRFTRVGLFMRAVADNSHGAVLVGIKTRAMLQASFMLSMVAAAIAGILIAPSTLLFPDLGFPLFVKAFAAAVLGGIYSLPGAVVGGVLIGVVENLVAGYISTQMQDLSAFIMIFLVLLLMPRGLFAHDGVRAV